jgi:very-short-patch-repair endonuclease
MPDVDPEKGQIGPRAGSREVEIAKLAAVHHSVVNEEQLEALGLSAQAARRRANSGRLHQLYPGVYAVGHPKVPWRGALIAAVYACGDEAVVSHRTGAALWALTRRAGGKIHVTVPRDGHRTDAIKPHRVRRLDERDRTEIDHIPVTSLPRTLLDFAEVAPKHELHKALEQAELQGALNLIEINDLLKRSRGRHGLKPLKAALTSYSTEAVTRSDLEELFLQRCKEYDVQTPQTNALISHIEVDALWPKQRLVVELDSRAFHQTTEAFERDRERDAFLQLNGYRVIRITWLMLTQNPGPTMARVRALLTAPWS